MRFWVFPLLLVPVTALSQTEFEHPAQYPSFRGISGLPGGTFGVLRDGSISMKGALSFSSPIAYSVGNNQWFFGISETSNDQKLRLAFNFRSKNGDILANGGSGKGVAVAGFTTPYGNLSGSFEVLSGKFNSVDNVEFTPNQDSKFATFAVGVQDVRGHGGFGGETYDNTHKGWSSRSFFGVATRPIGEKAYVSVGIGSQRFKRPFANASYGISNNVRAMAEYDGYNFNFGIGAEFGSVNWLFGRKAHFVTFLGDVRGKYISWTAGFTF